jgi:hypothetical protein
LPAANFMSNRAKWRIVCRPTSGLTGAAYRGIGFSKALLSFLFLGAFRGMRSHVFVFPVFDFRLGSVAMGQNVGPLVVGATFAIAGLAVLFVRS